VGKVLDRCAENASKSSACCDRRSFSDRAGLESRKIGGDAFSRLGQLTLDNGVSVTWDGDWCHDHPRTSWEGEWEFIGSDARMFWRGEQDSENRNRYHPVISIQASDGSTEKIPFQESIGDRRVPVLDHFVESILHARQPEPSVWDNVRVLRAVFGCIESSVSGREIFLKRLARPRLGLARCKYLKVALGAAPIGRIGLASPGTGYGTRHPEFIAQVAEPQVFVSASWLSSINLVQVAKTRQRAHADLIQMLKQV
jgi:hypothetical protein